MAAIYLTSGAYQSSSVIANCQRCVNLFLEGNPEKTKPPAPTTHYVRPGKVTLGTPAAPGLARGLYAASNGKLYAVVGNNVYYIDPGWQFNLLGTIGAGTSVVSMADNGEFAGNDLVLVDGTTNGYVITMSTNAFAPVVDPTGLFTGSDVVRFIQTFFLFNKTGTQNWYISLSDDIAFNALDIAAKASYADNIITIGVRQREVWLIGSLTTEPWSLTGAADFPFEAIPSTFVTHGILNAQSLVNADTKLFWLSNNLQGKAMFFSTEGYEVKRISHHGIEQIVQNFNSPGDCVSSTYQQDGHTFVVWSFPTDDMTLVYDLATEQWAQFAWTDGNGVLRRDRTVFYANAYGKTVGIDWETGELVEIDSDTYQDNDGTAITCIRGFPHVLNEMKRLTHNSCTVDVECGTITDPDRDPIMNLRYSDNRGQSFSQTLQTSMGMTGEYDISPPPQFNNLGMARDRVYEVFWAEKMKTALNAVYIEVEEAES